MEARLCSLLFAAMLTLPVFATQRPLGRAFATRSETIAPHALACTSHPLATQAALDVTKSGCSAVDAIAANAGPTATWHSLNPSLSGWKDSRQRH